VTVRILEYLKNVSVGWHALGTTSLIISILAAAPKHQSGRLVFRTSIDDIGVDGAVDHYSGRVLYVVAIGILMAQYTLTGLVGCICLSKDALSDRLIL
jgi:hypothetical protein